MPLPEAGPPAPGAHFVSARAVFVYYRVQPTHAAALQQAFAGVVARLGGWQPRLMRKVADDRDHPATVGGSVGRQQERLQTWMEVYRSPTEAPQSNETLRSLIDGCARNAGILALIDGKRHYEIFEPCA